MMMSCDAMFLFGVRHTRKSLIFQNLHRRISPAGAHDTAARMRRSAAHVEIANRRTILGPARRGPQKEELFQCQFTLKNISFRQTKIAFEIERLLHLPEKNDIF